ncbi:hypothetical protein MLD38_009453 [Melastoma candidum]|uniref:Uncharacterized protein n=1 Tax=Melastoma candidum TaxID=119954 RepID=A0ACB9RWQ9_9MYRT|nr:hypothetical protein MLD38_009453 [Melastoma candidum]
MESLSSTHSPGRGRCGLPAGKSSAAGSPRRRPPLRDGINFPRPVRRTSGFTAIHQPLDEITLPDTYSWNKLIYHHLVRGEVRDAVLTYRRMLTLGFCPDKHTFPRTISACRLLGDLLLGRQVHCLAVKHGFQLDHYVITALIEMYGRLDGLDAARSVFDKNPLKNSVSWTILARLLLEQKEARLVVDMFCEMVNSGMEFDPIALATAIGACGRLNSLYEGRNVYEAVRRCGLESDVLVSNALIRMFLDCGSSDDAWKIFERMPTKDVISWTTVIRGCVKEGRFSEGLKLFRMMVGEGLTVDSVSVSSILPACARMTGCKNGKEIHGHLLRGGIDVNIKVQNAIVDMYMKSGCVEYAARLFTEMEKKDAISWTIMILGYSLHGRGKLAMDMFHEMVSLDVETDDQTYAAVLYACATAGMVDEGKLYFQRIQKPGLVHQIQMVSLFSLAGLFDEAIAFIEEWRIQRQPEVLKAMLEGCRVHRHRRLGKHLAEQLCDMELLNPDNYTLLSNWHAQAGNRDAAEKFKEMIPDMGLKPQRAYSWIEHRNKVHVFGTGDTSHPLSGRIYRELEDLTRKIRDEGYSCDVDFSLHDVDEEREHEIIGHSEMLAVSFGLISGKAGETIRVTKNHHICHSCHDALRAFSKILQREILVKDLNFFHHFRDGHCSCFNLG